GPGPAEIEQPAAGFGGAAAGRVLAVALGLLVEGPAPLGRRGARRSGRQLRGDRGGRMEVDEVPDRGRLGLGDDVRRDRGYGFFPANCGRAMASSSRTTAACSSAVIS